MNYKCMRTFLTEQNCAKDGGVSPCILFVSVPALINFMKIRIIMYKR